MGLFKRSLRPPDDITPNPNDPASVMPASVGPDQLVNPGDPVGFEVQSTEPATTGAPPTIMPSAWSGWPAEWWPPRWNGQLADLTDTAWACIDLNASVLSTMPPYLVGAAPSIDAGWLTNPEPSLYSSVEEFLKQLFWDFQAVGEAFVLATSFYSTGWPATFHVLPPWTVEVDMDQGFRRYRIGKVEIPPRELCHLRYQSSTADAHGHGPLEAGRTKVIGAEVLARYAYGLASSGGIPSSVLIHPDRQSPEQSAQLKADWVAARMSSIGEPAVLSGGISWEPTQVNPKEMALVELLEFNESRIAVLLGVPPFLVGLPTGGAESMTYSNVSSLFDYHYRAGLRPKAISVMAGLSEWLLPRGTTIALNKESYVQAEPLVRAQTYQILNGILDAEGNPVLSVEQIRDAEHFRDATPTEGALR